MEDIEWLLHEPGAGRILKVNERARINDAQWDAVIERIDVAPGLRAFLTHATIHHDIVVQPRDTQTTPWASSTIAVAGHVEIEMPDGLRVTAGPDQAVLFRPSGRNPRYHVKAPQRLRLAGFALRRDRLDRIFDGAIPPALLPLLELEVETSRAICMRATRRLRHLAEGLFAPGLNGPLRLLFIEGIVLQLLACQMSSQIRPTGMLTARERAAVTTARRLLLLDMRQPPGLSDLADAVGLSASQISRRLARLEQEGVVERYAALLRPEAVGLSVQAFTAVSLERHAEGIVQGFEQTVLACPEILECWSVTGEADFVLRIVAPDLKAFADFLSQRLLRVPGMRSVRSSIVLHRIKQTTALPLEQAAR